MPRKLISMLLLMAFACLAQAQPLSSAQTNLPFAYPLETLASGQKLDDVFYYFEDKHSEYELEDVLNKPVSDWHKMTGGSLSFGYSESTYWFRAAFSNFAEHEEKRLFELSYPVLDYVNLYQRHDDESWQLTEMGDKHPFSAREFEHRHFLIPLELQPQSHADLIFQVKTSSAMQFPMRIWEKEDLYADDQNHLLAMGVYYGTMVAMLLYNFFIYFAVREKDYIYYVVYVGFLALFLGSLQGLNFQYFWPNATTWNDTSIVVFLGLAILFGMLFTFNFLKINHVPMIKKVRLFLAGSLLTIIFANLYVSYHHTICMLILMAILSVMLALVIGVYRWLQGHTSARYYVIAWSTILAGGVVMALSKFDIISRSFLTENVVQIGSAIEVILLSFALADRLNQEKRQRLNAQITALENEKLARQAHYQALKHERKASEAQAEALRVQTQATETLEERVAERTDALEQLNKQLKLMSITDPLTNIRNRRYFDRTLQQELARAVRQQEPLSVLIIDIDYFKGVNDSYGHQAGDEVLKSIAEHLSKTINRSTDLLARFGGEEFVVILPDTTQDGAVHVAQCILQVIAQLEFNDIDSGLSVTASIGAFGAVPTIDSHTDTWVRKADDALYYAKNNGRNQVIDYTQMRAAQKNEDHQGFTRVDWP